MSVVVLALDLSKCHVNEHQEKQIFIKVNLMGIKFEFFFVRNVKGHSQYSN